MKKYFYLFVCYLFSFSGVAGTWSLGVEVQNWNYREYVNGAELMRDYGVLKGVVFGYSSIINSDWSLEYSGHYLGANTKYDGQLQDGTPFLCDSKNSILNMELNFLRTYDTSAIFFGLAWQRLNNPELASVAADYSRDISYYYFPLGYQWIEQIGALHVTTTLSYYLFMNGVVNTALTDVGYSNDIKTKQNRGHGYYLSLAGSYASWKLEVYSRYWHVADSTVGVTYEPNGNAAYFNEPDNKTYSYGLRVSYLWE